MTVSIASRLRAEPLGQKKALRLGHEIIDELEDIKQRAMTSRPGRTIERAKSHLHAPNPDEDTARALRILDLAWFECQKAAGR